MDAWELGYEAARQGQGTGENPFHPTLDAEQWELWLDGYEWESAQLQLVGEAA